VANTAAGKADEELTRKKAEIAAKLEEDANKNDIKKKRTDELAKTIEADAERLKEDHEKEQKKEANEK
jgi:hypothetical protein